MNEIKRNEDTDQGEEEGSGDIEDATEALVFDQSSKKQIRKSLVTKCQTEGFERIAKVNIKFGTYRRTTTRLGKAIGRKRSHLRRKIIPTGCL